jgi:hypothetical protein
MNWLDAIFVVFLVLGALRGLFSGKLLPLLIIFSVWIMSIALAANFEDQLGDTFGDYHWYPLLAFFLILSIVQVAIYWSGIPTIVVNSIGWKPQKWMDMAGGVVLSACITLIYAGLVWRVLWEIAQEVAIRPGFAAGGSGFGAAYYDLIEGSAVRPALISFIEAFKPPLGVVLGSLIGAALIGLAIASRLRGGEGEDWADETEPIDGEGRDDEQGPETTSGTRSI